MVLTSSLLYLTTCCRSDSTYLRTIDPDLAGYIIEFKAEMEQRGALPSWAPLPAVIIYGHVPEGNLGIAYIGATPSVVIIAEHLRDSSDEYGRKSTVFHELTHAMAQISRHHTDPAHIMYYKHEPRGMDDWDKQMDSLARYIKKYSPIYRLKQQLEAPADVPD